MLFRSEAPQRPKGGAAPVAAPGGDAGRTSAESPSRRPADEKPGPTPEPADRAGTQRAGTLALGAVAGGAVVAALLGIGGAAWYFTRPTERDVEVTVAGAPSVTLAGRAPDERTGDTLRWRAVPLGQAVLRGVIGPKCVAGEESPAWCVETKADLEIPSGEGPFAYTFVVTPPPPRDLELRFTGLTGAPRARADDGAIVTGTAERAVLPAVSLGPHRVVVAVGTCTDADLGCGATCPAGCAGWSQEIEVPAGEGSFILTVPLQQPTAAVAPSAPHIAGLKNRSLLRAAQPIDAATSTAVEQARMNRRPSMPPRASAYASSVESTTAIGCTTAGSCTQSHSWLWI